MKTYKVTIKHFLNTNLKPFIMAGLNYYPIYVMVTARRKTTKIRSLTFNEYYTEEMFDEIMTSTDDEDKQMINDEVTAIERIARLIMNETGEFETSFFYSYVDFSNTINIKQDEIYKLKKPRENATSVDELYGTDYHIYSLKIDEFDFDFETRKIKEITGKELKEAEKTCFLGFGLNYLHDEIKKGLMLKRKATLYEFLGNTGQQIAKNFLKSKNLKFNVSEVLQDINKLHFYKSMKYFKYFVEGSKKTKQLTVKYNELFESYESIIDNYMITKYNM